MCDSGDYLQFLGVVSDLAHKVSSIYSLAENSIFLEESFSLLFTNGQEI